MDFATWKRKRVGGPTSFAPEQVDIDGGLPSLDFTTETPGGGEVQVTRAPLVAQSNASTVSGDDNDERPGILDALSEGSSVEDRAALNDPRASADQQKMRGAFDRMSNIFLSGGRDPLTPQADPYVSERDKARDWMMKRGGMARSDQTNALGAERTRAYLAATQAQQERALRAEATNAKARGDKAAADEAERKLKEAAGERDKQRVANDTERVAIAKAAEAKKKDKSKVVPVPPGGNRKDATELRKEFNQLPDVKTFGDIDASYRKIEQAAQDASPAGDLALITGYMKIIDPGSSVKEGEFANAQNAGGVPEKIVSQYNAIANGQRLAPSQRADFVKQSKVLYDVHRSRYDEQSKRYRDLATKANAAPDDVTGVQKDTRTVVENDKGERRYLNADGSLGEAVK
jgi:hypothetical protein